MTMVRHKPAPAPRRNPVMACFRAAWAVLCLFVGATDALITALLGITPLAAPWERIRSVIADRWRMAYLDAREAELVDESETDDVEP